PMLKEKGRQMAAQKAASEKGEAPDPDKGPAQAAPTASLDRSAVAGATSKPAEPAPTAPPDRRSFVGAFAGLATALTAAAVGHHLDQTT
ncbi:hypothetical protein C1X47_32775, partial [Pseudomonas sp. MPR-R2A2]